MKKLLCLLFLFSLPLFATSPDEEIPDIPVKFSAQLLSHQDKTYLVLNYENVKKWHTYWKNPGDAGLPIQNEFLNGDQSLQLEELEWPAPQKYIEQGNMLAYGYEGSYSLFYLINSNQLKALQSSPLTIKSKWLVCKHVCIPGKAQTIGNIQNNELTPNAPHNLGKVSQQELIQRLQDLPKKVNLPSYLDMTLTKGAEDQTLILYYNFSSQKTYQKTIQGMAKQLNLLTPFAQTPFDFGREKLHSDKKGNFYGRVQIQWDGDFSEPPLPFPKDGKFQKPFTLKFLFSNPMTKKLEVVEKTFASFDLTAMKKMEDFFNLVPPVNLTNQDQKSSGQSSSDKVETRGVANSSLLYYLLFAFIGGLILNVMPCVLPVISLKLFGLIKHSESSNLVIFKHNLFYSLGVLSCFMVFAGIVLALKSAGETIGWGFQLQSPIFISVMILLLFIFSLNLFGLFEFQTPGGKSLGQVQTKDGYMGDFLSGVLATILSTPCSAPFLGTALTFGFTSGGGTIIGIFLAIGLGLSFPFLLTGIFPKLISFLPKPGHWMNHMKKFLGVTLLITIAWLGDVFSSQVDNQASLIKLILVLSLILFAFIIRAKVSKNLALTSFLFLLPTIIFAHLISSPLQTANSVANDDLLKEKQEKGLAWEKWSEQKMQYYQDAGEMVFIDFTAKWCFTCKVNEKVVLETDGFRELVKEYKIKLLLADWTKRDDIIGDWLKSQGMVGVPAYFIQKPNGELIKLGETISLSKIEKNLN